MARGASFDRHSPRELMEKMIELMNSLNMKFGTKLLLKVV